MDPSIVDDVSEVVFMGGTVSDQLQSGIEFNMLVDPLAAREVLNAGWRKTVMVGLDVTGAALLYADDLARIKGLATPAALSAHSILSKLDADAWSSASKGTGGLEIYDACALAAWLRPELLGTPSLSPPFFILALWMETRCRTGAT
jgi:purine nucleosidase|eukprot:COSAG02_NODE_566_length_20219_cov_13.531759_4_plen_146_part_00